MLKGYEEENLKLMKKQREHDSVVKALSKDLAAQTKALKELKLKQLKENNGVFVEETAEDVDTMTKNVLGSSNALSKTELEQLYSKVKDLAAQNDLHKKDLALQATQFRAQIDKLRSEKADLEKNMLTVEFALGEKNKQVESLQD